MDFGDILDEWERLTAKPQGSKKQLKKQAEKKRAAASRSNAEANKKQAEKARAVVSRSSAGQTAPKPDEPHLKKGDPLSASLRIHGVYDKDAEAPTRHETGSDAKAAASRTSAGQTAPKPDEPRLKKGDPITAWLRIYGVYDKDADAEATAMHETGSDAGKRRRRLLQKEPDAMIDLHGLTQSEAWNALDSFFENSRQQGFEKLCIIHGKGNHSDGNAVLKQLARRFIECCPFAGESGHGNAASGGSGATWVILKRGRTC
ncbi:MAG: Smr/MutS family protein [Treponema sp.]|jgi:DNA-nicking Smr family endonuclease|nr:Smr/MutS family protein [Treponema sp.]